MGVRPAYDDDNNNNNNNNNNNQQTTRTVPTCISTTFKLPGFAFLKL